MSDLEEYGHFTLLTVSALGRESIADAVQPRVLRRGPRRISNSSSHDAANFGISNARMAAALQHQHIDHSPYRMRGFNYLFDVFPDGLRPAGMTIGLQNPQASAAFHALCCSSRSILALKFRADDAFTTSVTIGSVQTKSLMRSFENHNWKAHVVVVKICLDDH